MKINWIFIRSLFLCFIMIFFMSNKIISENIRRDDSSTTVQLEERLNSIPSLPSSPINFEIKLYKGWNLVSIPVKLFTNNIIDVLRPISDKYYSIWTFDFETGWKQYFPGELGEIFNNLDTIEHGKGYWINAADECKFTITGLKIDDTSIQLHSGWNLVGYNRLESLPVEDALYPIADKCKYFWTYKPEEGWIEYSMDSAEKKQNALEFLEPGMAYWINVIEDCVWDVGASKVLEPIQKYKQKIFSVKNYGAKADGITDDTEAIQLALEDAISSGGGTIIFPEGIYIISSPLKINSARDVTLEGIGDLTVIKTGSELDNAIQVSNSNNITIRSIKIEHNGKSYAVIAKGYCSWFTIEEATIKSKKSAIVLEDAVNSSVRNCTLFSADENVILMTYTNADKHEDLKQAETISNSSKDQIKYITTRNDVTSDNIKRPEDLFFASTTYSIGKDTIYGYNLIENNVIIQDHNYSGISVQTGGNRIIGNTILGKLVDDGGAGIFIGNYDQYIGSNYIYGFTHGIQIGDIGDTKNVGKIAIIGNIIRSCNIGIVTLSGGSVSIQGNHIVITDDGPWSERIGYYLGNKFSEITGGSVSYETLIDYKRAESRKYKGIVISNSVETATISNLNLINLEYGIIGDCHRVFINGCLFRNINLGLSNMSVSNTSYNIRDTVFKNVAYLNLNGNLFLDSCEFQNEKGFVSINKAYAQFKTENENYCVVRNCRFTNVLNTCITDESNYYDPSGDYGRADIEIRDDYIKIDSGTDWLDISHKFERLGIPLQTGREYLVYSNNKKYFYTLNGIITYGTEEPTTGTWNIGDKVENITPKAGGSIGWVCVYSGTMGSLDNIKGSIIGGSNVLVLNTLEGLKKGQWIKISELPKPKKIIALNPGSNIVILDSNVNVSFTEARISYSPAIFRPYGRINY